MSNVSSFRGTGNRKGTNPCQGYAGVLANRAGRILAAMLFLVFADGSLALEPVYSFEIPRQTADGALNALGEQADISVLYQYELVVKHETNQLSGRYTLEEAIAKLLSNSGLKAEFGTAGHLIIHADGEQNAMIKQTNERMPNASGGKSTTRTPLLKRLGTVITTAIFATSGTGAIATTDDTTEQSVPYIEEIIVTAEKREESILDVPMSMTALSGDKLEDLGLTNVFDLEQHVPGLQFGDDNEQKGHGTVIRGIGTYRGGWQVNVDRDLAVSTSVDDVFTFAGYGLAPQLFDLERVEILRGPQGTMRGRNAIAGAINYYTKKPTNEWDALVQTEFSDQFTQRYNVAFGGPISEHISFRITAGYLVSCHELNVGYRRSRLMRASFAVNCQLTVASN